MKGDTIMCPLCPFAGLIIAYIAWKDKWLTKVKTWFKMKFKKK